MLFQARFPGHFPEDLFRRSRWQSKIVSFTVSVQLKMAAGCFPGLP
jgi:hypothetical protein